MIKTDATIEKLLTIEKAVNEMVTLRQGILELKESEAQRQKALEELQRVAAHYRLLLENLPQRVYLKDSNLVYLLCNRSFASSLHINPEEIEGKTDEDFYPGELAQKKRSEDLRILATGCPESSEEVFHQEGKSSLWTTLKTPVKDESGRTLGLLGVSWDISEQRRQEEHWKQELSQREELAAQLRPELERVKDLWQQEIIERQRKEEELRAAEEFHMVFENLPTPVVVLDENGVVRMANGEFEKFSGFSKEELTGRKSWPELSDLAQAEDSEWIQPSQEDKRESGFADGDYRLRDRSGSLREVSCKFRRVSENGRIVVSLTDIARRKRTEEWIGTLEEKYNSLVENTREAVAIVQEGIIRFITPKVTDLLGYAQDELTSMSFLDLILPEDRESVEMAPLMPKNGNAAQSHPFRVVRKDGSVRWLEGRGSMVQWGKKPAALYCMTDITDQMQAKEELRSCLEPFRALVQAMDKYLFSLKGADGKKELV